MNCPQCGIQTSDGDVFCKNCGANLAEAIAPQQPQPPADPTPAIPPAAPKSGNGRVIAVILAALAVILACGAIGAYLLFRTISSSVTDGNDIGIAIVDPDPDDSGDTADSDKTPEDVIDDFYGAATSGDFNEAVLLFSAETRKFADPNMFDAWEPPSYQVLSRDITELGYVLIDVEEYDGGFSGGVVTYILIEEDGVWKIDDWQMGGVDDDATGDTEDPYASGLDPETATGAVGTLLVALQNDDMSGMRGAASDYFESNNADYFFPSSGALANFEILDVFEDGAVYIVIVREEWNSGPEDMTYIVIEEDGIAVVDDVYYE